jgi:hypothetical protein
MDLLFQGAYFSNLDISAWNVSNVVSMDSMFAYAYFGGMDDDDDYYDDDDDDDMFASGFSISAWDVSRVTSMRSMFNNAEGFDQNLCAWGCKLPAVVVTDNMFQSSNSCPFQDNPSFYRTPPGPFCYSCTSSCPTSAATSGP